MSTILKLASLVLGAVVVEDGCLARLHYKWYHLVTVKHVHLILLLLLLLVVFKVLIQLLLLLHHCLLLLRRPCPHTTLEFPIIPHNSP